MRILEGTISELSAIFTPIIINLNPYSNLWQCSKRIKIFVISFVHPSSCSNDYSQLPRSCRLELSGSAWLGLFHVMLTRSFK